MRILMLCDRIPPENLGGAEKVAWALARGLHDSGHEVHVIATTPDADFEEVRNGIPTTHLHAHVSARWQQYASVWNPQVSRKLKALYARIQPDVVSGWVIHNTLSFYSLWLAHRMGFATVYNAQDVMPFSTTKLTHYIDPQRCDYAMSEYRLPPLDGLRKMRTRYNPLRAPLIRALLNDRVDVRIAGSEVHRQTLEANGLKGFRVVHASVNPDDFRASPAAVDALRDQLDLRGRKVILFAGRLTADKGSHQILAALREIVRDVPQALLLTLTRATLEQQGLAAPEYASLRDHVRVGGWMQGETLAAAYHAAHVIVTPSICMDTFPTVNLEAMAAHKPVIATCFGGSPEAVIDGETGYIVNPFDTPAFADRLRRVLTDDALAARMGAAGHQRLLEHFTPQRHVSQMLALYTEAIALRRQRA